MIPHPNYMDFMHVLRILFTFCGFYTHFVDFVTYLDRTNELFLWHFFCGFVRSTHGPENRETLTALFIFHHQFVALMT